MPYPYNYSSPFLDDEAEVLGLTNGYEPYSQDSEGADGYSTTGPQDNSQSTPYSSQPMQAALPPNLSDKFIAPKLGELPGFVGDDMRIPIMKPPIPETEMTKQAMSAGMGQLRPPTIDQSNLQAYTQHMGTSPFGKKPGFWNKLAAGLYGGASVLAATQAQPHVTRVNPEQIGAGVQGLLRPGQGRAMQEWELKRRGLEDAARIEAANNATKMRQYGIEAQGPLNDSRIRMNEKHGNLYDAIGYSRLFNSMNPKQASPRQPTTREGLVTTDLQQRLNSSDPKIQAAAQQELDAWKKQQELRLIPAGQRSTIQALKQQYIDQGIDNETATIYATQDWMAEQTKIQEQKTKESESRVTSNAARSKRDIAIANKADRTPVGGSNNSAKADAETVRKGKALAESLRDQADNDPTKALAILAEMGSGIPDPVRVHAKSILMDRRDKKSKDDDIMSFVDQASGTGPAPVNKPAGKPASKPTSKPAAPSKPAPPNGYTVKVWDSKTGDYKK